VGTPPGTAWGSPTPRAAKKLVNLYQLVRIGIHDADLPAFLAEHWGSSADQDG
jgi:hypothetical protein